MNTNQPAISTTKQRSRRVILLAAITALLTFPACMVIGHIFHGHVERPADSEFGLGPRTSIHGVYRATIDPPAPLEVGPLQSLRLRLIDSTGKGIDGARIGVHGGMPQHGHGLPTRPRVTRSLGDGSYAVEGLKFNMGGWWTLTFDISSTFGIDTIHFNIDL